MTTKAKYRMVEGSPVNVLDFGADPSGAVSSSDAFDAAVNAAGNTGKVYVPKGRYLLTRRLELKQGGMCGEGVKAVILDFKSNPDDACVQYGDGVLWDFQAGISDFTIQGNLNVANQAAIKCLRLGTSSYVKRVKADPCNVGIFLDECFYTSFEDINLFGQFEDGQDPDIQLTGFGIYGRRPINNLVFTNVSVQYFGNAVSIYDDVSETETSNNVLFNKCSFERITNTCFLFRRCLDFKFHACYTEATAYHRDPLNTNLTHILYAEDGSRVSFDSCRLSMTGYAINDDQAFNGQVQVLVTDSFLFGGGVVSLTEAPFDETIVMFNGFKNSDLNVFGDYFDANVNRFNQNAGGVRYHTAHELQTTATFKTWAVEQLSTDLSNKDVAKIAVKNIAVDTGITFDVLVSRKNQSSAARTMKYTVTILRNAGGIVQTPTVTMYGGDIADYFTSRMFPADPADMFDVTTNVVGNNTEYQLELKPFTSISPDATDVTTQISGTADFMYYSEPRTTQRTDMLLTVDNKIG